MTQKPLKIGVNGWFLDKLNTGIGKYFLHTFIEVAKLAQKSSIELYIFVPNSSVIESSKALLNQPNVNLIELKLNNFLQKIHSGLAKSFWEKHQLKAAIKRFDLDVFHSPYPSLTDLKALKTILISTVHDTIPWTEKDYQNRGFLSQLYNQKVLKALQLQKNILTVSKASAEEIKALIGDQIKIDVIYNACTNNFKMPLSNETKEKVLKKYNIAKNTPYLFYLGGFDKRKNTVRLIKIFKDYFQDSDLNLVLGGVKLYDNSLYDNGFNDQNSKIIYTGFIDENDLPALYQSAESYISLTTREGFNLPLLEALTSHLPVIISDLKVHREVAGDLAFYLDLKLSDQEIAEQISDFLKNKKSHYKNLIESAKLDFDWEKSAKKLIKIYQTLKWN